VHEERARAQRADRLEEGYRFHAGGCQPSGRAPIADRKSLSSPVPSSRRRPSALVSAAWIAIGSDRSSAIAPTVRKSPGATEYGACGERP